MKHLSRALIAVILAVLMAGLYPAQVFADTPDYISEVKVFEGNYDNAEKEGYTLLNGDNGKPVDLNADAGATGTGAKGNKAVYLGYKTTKDKDEAITDLALMNMKGGYSVKEYEALMETQMSQQIIPFVEMFLATINEYRENFNSGNAANKARATYIHDVLNKMTDDDTNGAGLGDLLLNETVYEMAKPQYDALSETEKAKTTLYEVNEQVRDSLPDAEKDLHADLLTIIAQSNGKATLMIQNLLTRAADTAEDTWLERFEGTTYDDLMNLAGGSPTDARKKLARAYDDDAYTLLESWGTFAEALEGYDDALATLEEYDENAFDEALTTLEDMKGTNPEVEDAVDATVNFMEERDNLAEAQEAASIVALHDYLESVDYLDGTLLDFFTQSEEDIEDDITLLYPIIASLSAGQRAGLEFFSLKEMLMIGVTDTDGYKETELDKMASVSIYDGVDRGIYEKGGVALTSDALRADALANMGEEDSELAKWSNIMLYITLGTGAAALLSGVVSWTVRMIELHVPMYTEKVATSQIATGIEKFSFDFFKEGGMETQAYKDFVKNFQTAMKSRRMGDAVNGGNARMALHQSSKYTQYLSVGLTVAFIVLVAVTTVLTYMEMKARYKVDFTPIPHYMVEEKDLIGYNSKGEKIVLKNQSAYYKAVESNRKKGDSYFDDIDTCADMNGCVGKQWLALYAAKNEAMAPILASSLKVVVDSSDVPAGYATGIHMFGEDAAFNLNNKLYCWNDKAKSVMVYFKTDETAVSTTGSNFTGGTLALSAGGGLLLGAAVTALGMTASRKRKENKTVTV